jgi:hypothetical protein
MVSEGKNFTLHCNVQNESVIWKINGIALNEQTIGYYKNFQSAPNSTLIISNPVLGVFGVFNVTCMVNISSATDGKNYRVHCSVYERY